MAASFAVAVASPARALDRDTPLAEYSLTNWPENAGPFPFGVYAIAQDQDGYLWLGTRTGLIRFDGTSFTVWQGQQSLPQDRISVLHVTRDGSLWLGFGTGAGVSRIRHGLITSYDERDGFAGGAVNGITEDEDGAVWVGAFGGLSRWRDGRWERFGLEHGLPEEAVHSLFKDSTGTLWVGTTVGVYRRGPQERAFALASTRTVTDFTEDASGTIWVGDTQKGFDALLGEVPSPVLSDLFGRALLSDRSGSLWVGTRSSGLLRVRDVTRLGQGNALERLSRREGLLSDEIRTLFEDRDGALWIGTRMGLSRLSESSVRAVGSGAQDAYVYAVTRTADGSVWTATADGLWRQHGSRRQQFGPEHGLPGRIVTALHEDRGGTLWAATTQGIAYSAGGRFSSISFPRGTRLEHIRSLTTDQDGAVWICDSIKGLFRWHNGQLVRQEGERDGPPYASFTDRAGRVWIGYWTGGLAVYQHNQVTRYTTSDGLPAGTVNVIYEDQGGSLWVGTSTGLARLAGTRFITFRRNGFPDSPVVSIVEDRRGHHWFGLGSELLHVKRDEFARLAREPSAALQYTLYGAEDGLPGTLGRPGMPSATRGGDGRLWFVTSVGLALVNPDNLRERPAPGPVRIEGFVVDGQRMEPAARLELAPGTSRIQIDYSILNLAAAPKVRSRYKLEGFDSDWQDAGVLRQASYTNLPPGSYRFTVASTDGDGAWTESGAVLDLTIAPAFYQRTTFYGAVAVVLGAVVASAWQLRLRHMRQHFALVLAERARVGREIHDTLLQSLVAVALEFDDIASQLEPSSGPLKRQVDRIREQVERHVREARRSIWDLRSPTLEATDLPTALRNHGEAATAERHVHFELVVTGRPRPLEYHLEEQLLRIGQEAINNAVRHGEASLIRAEIVYEAESVCLRVSDDGRGFDPESVKDASDSHWGVTTMRERAEQIGARFNLISFPGAGTTVEAVASVS